MAWLPGGEIFFKDIFIRLDKMYERDRQTDRHTHRMTTQAALIHRIARQKLTALKQSTSVTDRQTDRQRDGQTELSAIIASRGKNSDFWTYALT